MGVLAGARGGDAEARADAEGVLTDRERPAEGVQERARRGLPGRRPDQGQELVATEPRQQRVLVGAPAQPLGDGHEQRVADGVPEAVVDALEVVEVDEDDRDRLRFGDRVREPLAEQRAVGQAGQRVVPGVMTQYGLAAAQPAGQLAHERAGRQQRGHGQQPLREQRRRVAADQRQRAGVGDADPGGLQRDLATAEEADRVQGRPQVVEGVDAAGVAGGHERDRDHQRVERDRDLEHPPRLARSQYQERAEDVGGERRRHDHAFARRAGVRQHQPQHGQRRAHDVQGRQRGGEHGRVVSQFAIAAVPALPQRQDADR